MLFINIFSVSLTSVEFSFESNISIGITNTTIFQNIRPCISLSPLHDIPAFNSFFSFISDIQRGFCQENSWFVHHLYNNSRGGSHRSQIQNILWFLNFFWTEQTELDGHPFQFYQSEQLQLCFFRLFLLDAMIESVIGGIIILLAPAPIKDPFSHLSLCQK